MTRTRTTRPADTPADEPSPQEEGSQSHCLEGDSFCGGSDMSLECDARVLTNLIIQHSDVPEPRLVWPKEPSQDQVHVSE